MDNDNDDDDDDDNVLCVTAVDDLGKHKPRKLHLMLVVFYRCATEPLYENMTSSTKPEIHNVSQRLQRRNEPRPVF